MMECGRVHDQFGFVNKFKKVIRLLVENCHGINLKLDDYM